jgi:large subunit ribosomal protein L29
MKFKELAEKDQAALEHELKDKLKHLYDLRTQAVTEKLEDPTQLGKTKRDIARVKTAIRQRQVAEAKK